MNQSTSFAQGATNLLNVLQGYTKGIRFLLVMLLTLTASTAWAETVTYTVSSTSAVTKSGTAPDGSSATYQSTYTNTKCQLTGGNSMTLTLSGYDGCTITGLTLSMKSNKDTGAGSMSMKIGSTTSSSIQDSKFNSNNWHGSWSKAYVDVTPSVTATTVGNGEEIVITIAATANSLYCQSFTLTYTPAGGGGSTTVDPEVTFSNGEYTIGGAALDLSTLWESNSTGAVTYSVTNAGTTGATVNGTSFTATAAGTCTVQASQAPTATHNAATATATITVTAPAGGGGGEGDCIWTLVTDDSNLAVGDEIVIAAKDYNYALSTTQNNNNRGQASVTKDGNTITFGNDVQIITLGSGVSYNGTFVFNTGLGYLYAAGANSNNYLRTSPTTIANGDWEIAITNNIAYITAQGTASRNMLRYNTNGLFSCYAVDNEQKDIAIYKKICTTETSYSVTYNGNGNTSGYVPEDNTEYEKDAQVTVLGNTGTLAKTGYTFSGWNTKSDGTGTTYAAGDKFTITENTTLYAKWEAIPTYTVTFDSDGGSAVTAQTIETGETATKPENPEKAGHTFVGWYNGDTEFDFDTPITDDITLKAKWTINQYTVTLNPNYPAGKTGTFKDKGGNTINGNLVQTYDYNTASMSLTDLYQSIELEGYQFNGWYSATSGGSKWTSTGIITKDVTVYAQWSKLYTITLSENGTTTTPITQTSTSYTLPTELSAGSCQEDTKELVGWSTVAIPTPGDKPTDNFYDLGETVPLTADQTTFYAVFATAEGVASTDYAQITDINNLTDGKYVIAYGYNNTTPSIILKAATKDETTLVATSASPSSDKYQNPAAENIWSIKKNGTTYTLYNDATSKYVQANTTPALLLADANPTEFQISYSTDHWKIKLNTATTYQLVGYTNQSGNYFQTKSEASNSYKIQLYKNTSTVSYSAYTTLCDATKATITYDLNGGTGATCNPQTVTKDVEFTLCDQTPTKDGYTFAGWSDGTKTYTAGSSATVSESTTFYATWTPNTITITWYQNYNDCPKSETSTYIYDGEEIEMPDDPTREGYKFIGWYTFPNEGTIVTEVGNTNKPTANVTYYARWAQLFTVTFMASGQNYVVQEHKYLSGDNLELPVENPSAANYACDGYIFEGWTDVVKPDEDATPRSLVTIATTIDRDQTFYALWKKASSEGAGETIFYESFNNSEGTGGNDDKWSGDIAKSEANVDNNGWEGDNVSGAKQCIKLGGGSAKGYITTPALSQLSGNATLSFKAAAWNGSDESTTLVLSIEGGGSLSKTSVTLTKGAWQSYEVTITGGTPSTRITFAGKNASDSRFFLDEVKVTTSGSYNYTTSPSCGPTIVAKEGMWVTSANGQSVKVNVPIAIKSFTNNATITGTTANSNFAVTTLENTGNGEHNLVVTYTPNASDIKEDAAITLTAKDGEETISTTTFTLNGRSLPDQFAIVVDNASEYFALPANMPSEGTYAGFGVTLNAGSVTSAPKTHLYTAQAVHSTRFAENGTALRLVGNNNACLWATNAVSGTDICNYAQLDNAKTADYEWHLYTEDGDAYRISCTAVTEEGRILRMYGANFGMYKSGAEVFYLLPVECTSTPTNIQVSPARVSATISWENAATCDLQVLKEGTPVQTISGAVSPVVVIDLEELTAYTFTLTPTDAASCKVDGAFTTTGPDIDIVEWMTDGMIIQVDKDDAVNPSVVINGEVEYNTGSGAVATELFFSKYFEAHGENKLLAIYNGTGAPINLSGYEIKSENGALDLSQFGQTKGQVAPNEEIILVYYDEFNSAEECAELQEGYENWNILTEKSVLAFSGRGSIGLYKDDVLIDVIGSTFPSGELTKIGRSDDGCGTGEDVRLHIDEESVNDQSSFFCYYGDNIKTDEEENDYAISTNRCLLIRKNTVTSGANAVASNKAAVGATCGDLSLSFTTLCSEWSGFRIGSGKSSSDEIKEATCDGLGYVGGFDYSKYYREYQQIGEPTTLDEFEINKDENLYKITIDPLSNYSCLNVSVELRDPETDELLTQQVAQVPIIVASENTTTDELFSNIIADDLDASKTRCSTCDVVILKDATLTKAAVDTENDVNQVRDIYIYPGGKLVVPAEGNDYSVNSLSLRRVEDEVSMASVQTPLLITSSAANPIYVDVRVNSENWHWFTLPYNCNIADVTWADGTPAKYNVDWFLMWYDGESRAASTNPHDNHWKVYEGTTLEAGKGYIVGITGHPTKSKVKYELRFPMAQGVLTAEKEDKTVAVNAWGITKEIGPNNKGWNLVGNPYMDYYQPNTNGFAGLPLIKYLSTNSAGEWLYEESGGVPFLVIPQDGGWSEYKQELTSDVDMQPFTAYFVQVGNPENHEDGEALNANFEADKRGRSSLIRRAPSEVDEQEEPAIVAISLTNAKGESDKTTLLIADRFTNEYEMNADFFKWFGDYYTYYTKPVLYTLGADNESRAFNALNEELAAQPVALGMYAAQAGEYTFSLYQRSELSRVEEVWLHDATSDTHTNLMLDNYTFSTSKTDGAGRFSLSVKMKPKIATDIDDIRPGQVWATSQDNEVIVNGLNSGLQLWLYDAVGKLLYAEPTTNYQHRYTVPQDGVYFITVKDVAQVRTIKVVVE